VHLRTFANQSRMRRLLLGLMASSISGGEANRLLEHFYAMDSDFSGSIEMQELAQVAKQVSASSSVVRSLAVHDGVSFFLPCTSTSRFIIS